MKSLQHLCAVIALTLMFTLTAFAGEISTGLGTAPPPPPQQSSVMGGGLETPLNMDEASDEATSLSPGAEIGLSLLRSVLALF